MPTPGGLVVERDGLADQLFVVRATQPRGHDPGSAVVDECEIREVEVEQLGELVEEQAGDLLLVVRIEQAVGESVDARELPVAQQRSFLCLAGAPHAADEQVPVVPPSHDQEERQRGEHDRAERDEHVPGERLAVLEGLDAEDRGAEADTGEDERGREADLALPTPLAPQRGDERHGQRQIQRREDEQRHCVEHHRLRVCVH